MNGNGHVGMFDTIFKGAVALGGTLMGAVMVGGGRKLMQLDREVGELKSTKEAVTDAIGEVRKDVGEVKQDVRELRRVVDDFIRTGR